ncbi:Ty1/Copia family ribonuclease HI [bacterium]|nr:Ty1/Copia family ribonuclease HI [bacterium]
MIRGVLVVYVDDFRRSSRQSVSALSTAEAELYSATLGWQIAEGLRHLMTQYGVQLLRLRVFVDNQAALTIAKCGANLRTRYFAVRGHRLHEEHARGAIELLHCLTAGIVADPLTKRATAPVIEVLHKAMDGVLPSSFGQFRFLCDRDKKRSWNKDEICYLFSMHRCIYNDITSIMQLYWFNYRLLGRGAL